ncbi:MAG: CDP-glycerol glycerophosphotransferase family protein [Bifidobacteriaceae bacterium]|jgi:CDP-glycerol glycerophosphotransferase (TagB/SpsB family)|nr:CDP-glycerol glycerophosphotransferase family protein [Bifidobacteriaceae bacterium]
MAGVRALRSWAGQRVRSNLFLHKWRFAPTIIAYALWRRVAPVEPRRVAFLSDSRDGFSGNFALLRDELARQDPEAEVVAVFRRSLRVRRPWRDAWRLPRVIATSRVIVLDDYFPQIYPLRLRPETALVQVWHAVGAFKRMGHSRAGLPGGPPPGALTHRNYTAATVSSEAVRPYYAEAYGIDAARVFALGVPRTDAFFDAAAVARAGRAVRERWGIAAGRRIALFAPTFRGKGQRSAYYDYDWVDFGQLAARLGEDWAVLVKMHPFVRPLDQARTAARGVIDVTREREMTELMMAADVLVTDYSSAVFEYALLDRPIVYFCPDLADYTAARDFYRPFAEYVIGPLVTDARDLAGAIQTAQVDRGAARVFLETFASALDGHSTERIVRALLARPGGGA